MKVDCSFSYAYNFIDNNLYTTIGKIINYFTNV